MIQLASVVVRVSVAGLTDAGVAVTAAVNIVLGHSSWSSASSPEDRSWFNAMDLSVFDVVGVSGAGGGLEAVLVTERDVVPKAVVARAWR